MLIRFIGTLAQVYSVAELLQLSKSPLVQTSLASEQKQGIIDVMSCIPHEPRRRAKNRSPSPTESGRSPSLSLTTTKSRRPPSPTKKARKSPAPETVSLPKVDTPPSPHPGSSKRRLVETNATTHSDSGRHHHGRRQWGYAPSSHHNEDNWRAHPSLAITV